MPTSWPLTGRSEELRLAAGVIDGAGGGVVLAGAAGVGKTRLAREVLAQAARRDAVVRWTVATESARAVPLGALTLLTEGASPVLQLEHAADAIAAPGVAGGLVLGVDDAHLLDPLSALVLQQLALAGRARLVLTVRSGEPAPDAVAGLWKDRHLRRVELRPLSEAECHELLEGVLAGPVEVASARRLWAATGGSPLYLRVLVDGERAGGRLRCSAGIWQWRGRPRLSADLADLLAARLGEVSAAERDVLDLLAFGEPLDLRVLGELADPAALEALEDRGVVEVIPGRDAPAVRMGHPLYGEAHRSRCGVTRARRLRGRIADALAGAGRDETLRRGVLALDSDLPADPGLLSGAAELALAMPDLLLAERLARAAVAAGAGFAAHRSLVSALVGLNRPAEAELVALGEQAGTDAERVQAAVMRGMQLLLGVGHEACAGVLEAAESAVTDAVARAELHALLAVTDVGFRAPGRAAERSGAVLAVDALSPAGVAIASWARTMALAMLGRADELDAATRRGLAALVGTPSLRWLVLPLLGHQLLGLRLVGRLAEAAGLAAAFRSDHGEMPFGAESSSLLLGTVELAAGRVRTARRLLGEAGVGLGAFPPTVWLARCLADLAQAHAQSGAPDRAREVLRELDGVSGVFGGYVRTEALLAGAWTLAAEGATSAAVAQAREAADDARRVGAGAYEAQALHDAVCLGDRGVADRLAALAGEVAGPFAPAAAAHAAALAADDGAGLLAAAAAFERGGMTLRAADAAAHAAAAYTRSGMRGSAQLATATATRLAAACAGAHTPALRDLVMPPSLSRREREIAALVAAGLSNREIADRLTVSVRTVEGHVYRACNRLGLSSRAELASVVDGGGSP